MAGHRYCPPEPLAGRRKDDLIFETITRLSSAPLTSTPLGERASRRSAYTPSAGKPAGRGGTIDPSSEEPD
ncbi:MAG: hypothetical protein JW861_10705 [Bacteroidales bacterium]|nr:hypothetical protein [Bacteroidales bacterium]